MACAFGEDDKWHNSKTILGWKVACSAKTSEEDARIVAETNFFVLYDT